MGSVGDEKPYPDNVAELAAPISELEENMRKEYKQYLSERVLKELRGARPWGLNGTTLRHLLMHNLAQQLYQSRYPLPTSKEVDGIMESFWSMTNVTRQQKKKEQEFFELSLKDEKPKRYATTGDGPLRLDTILDVGANAEILREVVKIREERKLSFDKPTKCKKAFAKAMEVLPAVNNFESFMDIESEKEVRRDVSFQAFAYEDTTYRWDWLKNKQDQMKKIEIVDAMAEKLFTMSVPMKTQRSRAGSISRKRASSSKSETETEKSTGTDAKKSTVKKRKPSESATKDDSVVPSTSTTTTSGRPTRAAASAQKKK